MPARPRSARRAEPGERPAIDARLVLTLVFAVLLVVFWDSAWLWPLKVLVVAFHELSHALAAWLTGGEVVAIGLSPDQGGVTLTRGGSPFVILNAGYLGSLLWGAALLAAARRPRSAHAATVGLAALLAATSVLFVRPILSFGFFFAIAAALGLWAVARWLSPANVAVVLRGLGVFSILYAVFDIRDDVFLSSGLSDAAMLAEATYVPAFVWGTLWLLAGFATLWALRRWLV